MTMTVRKTVLIGLFLLCGGIGGAVSVWAAPVSAALTDVSLSDAAAEARAVAIMRDLRCMVCQSQSVADSDAPLAADMRQLVRADVAAGKSDEAIKGELAARYGDGVLMRPPVRPQTLLLWGAPLLLFLGGGWVLCDFFRKRAA